MKISYIDRGFSQATLAIIEQANEIIGQYQADGLVLTVRQLYYQFVARSFIPNRQAEYKRLGSIINDGRLAGLIDWDSIEDRGRNLQASTTWCNPRSMIEMCVAAYREDLWGDQEFRPEVWIEKEALLGVIERICYDLRVPYFACRGYVSQSECHQAGAYRLSEHIDHDQIPVIIHLGDHDPSGIDMTRDITTRLSLFAGQDVTVQRIALNWDQIKEYSPPPNPAKSTDSRFASYVTRFGEESWELDALDPAVLVALIERAVASYRDDEIWAVSLAAETRRRETLSRVAKRWPAVQALVNRRDKQ